MSGEQYLIFVFFIGIAYVIIGGGDLNENFMVVCGNKKLHYKRLRNFGGLPKKTHPNFSNFLFHFLAQCVTHGWKALVLRIPEHLLFFLCDFF